MAEKELDVIIKAQAQNLAEVEAAHKAIQSVGVEVQSVQTKVAGANVVMKAHAAEHTKIAQEARESARAMGEMGAKGGELFERFSALTTAAGGLQGTLLGVGLLGAGAVVEGFHKVDETYQEQLKSANDLQQATEATGRNYDALSDRLENYIDINARYIENENQARDALAGFVRAGFDEDESMKALSAAIDLAAIKHEDLATAGRQTLLIMEGSGRAAKELGIDMKTLAADDETATKAHKDLEEANKKVEEAQKRVADTARALKEENDALHEKSKVTQHDLDILQDKQKAAKDATDTLTKAQQDQKDAQDKVNNSMADAAKRLDELGIKVDSGHRSLTELQQSQFQLNHDWDHFAHDTGPSVDAAWLEINRELDHSVVLLDAVAVHAQAAWGWLSKIGSAQAAFAGGGGGVAGGDTSTAELAGGRQAGGAVLPGRKYRVGEGGPEDLIMGPGGGGWVVPNSGGGGSGQVIVNVSTDADPYQIASEIGWALRYGG